MLKYGVPLKFHKLGVLEHEIVISYLNMVPYDLLSEILYMCL